MWAWVSTTRRTGSSSAWTAAANGSHWERTISVSMIVIPSSSTTTPALLTPVSPPGWSHAYTPSASSCSVNVGTACATQRGYRYGGGHVRALPHAAPPVVPVGPRIEPQDARQGAGSRRRHGVPRPRGLGRAPGEGSGARQRREGDQRA